MCPVLTTWPTSTPARDLSEGRDGRVAMCRTHRTGLQNCKSLKRSTRKRTSSGPSGMSSRARDTQKADGKRGKMRIVDYVHHPDDYWGDRRRHPRTRASSTKKGKGKDKRRRQSRRQCGNVSVKGSGLRRAAPTIPQKCIAREAPLGRWDRSRLANPRVKPGEGEKTLAACKKKRAAGTHSGCS